MTTPAPTLYEATLADRAARLTPVADGTDRGLWAAFQAGFENLLDAFRSGDAARLEHARHDVAELRARLAAGGVAVPEVTRRARPQPAPRSLSGLVDR